MVWLFSNEYNHKQHVYFDLPLTGPKSTYEKKNNFVSERLSFEDFEQAITRHKVAYMPVKELVQEWLATDKETLWKERELKKKQRKSIPEYQRHAW